MLGKQLLRTLKGWRDYAGRSSRAEYWTWAIVFFALALASPLLLIILDIYAPIPATLISYWWYVLLPPHIAVSVRRMHDVGKPGWYFLIPLYGFYLLIQPSVERGVLPLRKIFEYLSLIFIPLSLANIILDPKNVGSSMAGALLWSLIYGLLRWFNSKKVIPRDVGNV